MAVVLVAALFVGTPGARTTHERRRVDAVAPQYQVPDVPRSVGRRVGRAASKAIRTEIARRMEAGESDDEIRAYFAQTLRRRHPAAPPSRGCGGLVWVLPVVGLVAAIAGLGYAFWRWAWPRPSVPELTGRRSSPGRRRLDESSRDARHMATDGTALDPDALATLEEERGFLQTVAGRPRT